MDAASIATSTNALISTLWDFSLDLLVLVLPIALAAFIGLGILFWVFRLFKFVRRGRM